MRSFSKNVVSGILILSFFIGTPAQAGLFDRKKETTTSNSSPKPKLNLKFWKWGKKDKNETPVEETPKPKKTVAAKKPEEKPVPKAIPLTDEELKELEAKAPTPQSQTTPNKEIPSNAGAVTKIAPLTIAPKAEIVIEPQPLATPPITKALTTTETSPTINSSNQITNNNTTKKEKEDEENNDDDKIGRTMMFDLAMVPAILAMSAGVRYLYNRSLRNPYSFLQSQDSAPVMIDLVNSRGEVDKLKLAEHLEKIYGIKKSTTPQAALKRMMGLDKYLLDSHTGQDRKRVVGLLELAKEMDSLYEKAGLFTAGSSFQTKTKLSAEEINQLKKDLRNPELLTQDIQNPQKAAFFENIKLINEKLLQFAPQSTTSEKSGLTRSHLEELHEAYLMREQLLLSNHLYARAFVDSNALQATRPNESAFVSKLPKLDMQKFDVESAFAKINAATATLEKYKAERVTEGVRANNGELPSTLKRGAVGESASDIQRHNSALASDISWARTTEVQRQMKPLSEASFRGVSPGPMPAARTTEIPPPEAPVLHSSIEAISGFSAVGTQISNVPGTTLPLSDGARTTVIDNTPINYSALITIDKRDHKLRTPIEQLRDLQLTILSSEHLLGLNTPQYLTPEQLKQRREIMAPRYFELSEMPKNIGLPFDPVFGPEHENLNADQLLGVLKSQYARYQSTLSEKTLLGKTVVDVIAKKDQGEKAQKRTENLREKMNKPLKELFPALVSTHVTDPEGKNQETANLLRKHFPNAENLTIDSALQGIEAFFMKAKNEPVSRPLNGQLAEMRKLRNTILLRAEIPMSSYNTFDFVKPEHNNLNIESLPPRYAPKARCKQHLGG